MNQIIPAAVSYQKRLAGAINATKEALGSAAVVSSQIELLKKVMELINNVYATDKEILARVDAACAIHDEQKKAEMLGAKVKPKMDEIREYVDALEGLVDDEIWPLPKFWEILFIN
jgi:glutamine synthetase